MKLVRAGLLIGAALWVCSGCGGSKGSTEGAEEEESELPDHFTVFPAKLWSGFDGVNKYRSPVIAVVNTGNVTWTIDDPSIASIDTQSKDPVAKGDGTQIVLTSLKAGTTTLHAKDSAGHTSEATLVITMYPAAQFEAGKARYMKGPDMKNPACTECHAKGKGPDHTPTELDADTDEEIRNTFTMGIDPEGRFVDYEHMFTKLLNGLDHKWQVTEDEKIGLIAYLRALPPLAFPEYDAPTTEK